MSDDQARPELEAFRQETRSWLRANFPPSLKESPRGLQSPAPGAEREEEQRTWRNRLAEKGWTTPTWPAEYGGGGLSQQQASVLQQEMDRIGAFNPLRHHGGVIMIGPTLLDFGSHEQKQRHLPPIIRGEVSWCIGYSEPGAGSDLASLSTRCIDAGDHWLVNGQKVWTSGAAVADWCGLLVRTDTSRKHDGISFLLINMRQPGVEVRPIKLISGTSPFSEVFLADARAAKGDMLGKINQGWSVGKRLLLHERVNQTGGESGVGARTGAPSALTDLAKSYVGSDAASRLADPDLRTRITRHLMDARAHDLTLARVSAEGAARTDPSPAVSILKNSASRISQERSELTLEVLGHQGLGADGPEFAADELDTVRDWLFGKAYSIWGGTLEVQNNIVAKRILGLPDPNR